MSHDVKFLLAVEIDGEGWFVPRHGYSLTQDEYKAYHWQTPLDAAHDMICTWGHLGPEIGVKQPKFEVLEVYFDEDGVCSRICSTFELLTIALTEEEE